MKRMHPSKHMRACPECGSGLRLLADRSSAKSLQLLVFLLFLFELYVASGPCQDFALFGEHGVEDATAGAPAGLSDKSQFFKIVLMRLWFRCNAEWLEPEALADRKWWFKSASASGSSWNNSLGEGFMNKMPKPAFVAQPR